ETMSRSQLPLETKASMSEICLSSLPCASATVKDLMSSFKASTCACMLVQPTTRHGLKRPALEKQIRYGPGFLYCAVSTSLPPRCCSQGLSAGPCGVIRRRSLAAWNSFGSSKFWASAPPAMPAKAAPAIVEMVSLNIINLLSSLIADARRLTEREARPLSYAAAAPGAERDRGNQDGPLRRLLERLRQPKQSEQREERRQRERSGDGPDQRSASTHQLNSTDDAGRDGLQFEPEAHVDRDAAESR